MNESCFDIKSGETYFSFISWQGILLHKCLNIIRKTHGPSEIRAVGSQYHVRVPSCPRCAFVSGVYAVERQGITLKGVTIVFLKLAEAKAKIWS